MSRPRPHERLCPICWSRFIDIWAYKAHQDACIARHRKERAA